MLVTGTLLKTQQSLSNYEEYKNINTQMQAKL